MLKLIAIIAVLGCAVHADKPFKVSGGCECPDITHLYHHSHHVQVFGVGLSKTGTHSLGTALSAMGYKNIHMDHAFTPHLAHDGKVC